MHRQIPPFLLGETEWPDAITSGDLLFHIPIQLAYTAGTPEDITGNVTISLWRSNLTTLAREFKLVRPETSYGDFREANGNYIDTGFKPADITAGNPFEVVFKHKSSSGMNCSCCAAFSSASAYTGSGLCSKWDASPSFSQVGRFSYPCAPI